MDRLSGVDVLGRGYETYTLGLQALQPLIEINEATPKAIELGDHDAIEPVLTRRLQQFVKGGQLVHGTRVSGIDKLAVHAPAAAVDEVAHHPKLEGAGRVSLGRAGVQCATGSRGLVSHAVIVSV
jgi:hypothetical protein